VKFPLENYPRASEFCAAYFETVSAAMAGVDTLAVERAAGFLTRLFSADRTLYVCGNGGSAAIANHLLCDFAKGIQTGTVLRPKVVSLSSHVELITAIGNDLDFADIFAFQLRTAAREGDALMTISASGNSENIVRAMQWAVQNKVQTLALTGFGGGRSAKLANYHIHVPAANYGVAEDVHQSVMHILAQFIRMRLMDPATIAGEPF
jgi:D-sedoheptulose 7-phosphate isomerase